MEYPIKLNLEDFDNNEVDFYRWAAKAYHAMFDALHRASGIDRKIIVEQSRQIYTDQHTIEYPLLVQQLPCFQGRPDLKDLMVLAKQTFSKHKREHLELFPGTKDRLEKMKKRKISNIIISDGPVIQICKRIMHLKIEHLISGVVGTRSPDASEIPDIFRKQKLEFPFPIVVSDVEKPYTDLPNVLGQIKNEYGDAVFLSRHAIFTGDNITKDIGLAIRNVLDAYLNLYGQPNEEDRLAIKAIAPYQVNHKNTNPPAAVKLPKLTNHHQKIVEVNSPQQIIADLQSRNFMITRD